MPGERNSPPDPQYRRRWGDYLSSLETIKVLERALETARASAEKQRAEVLELFAGEKWEMLSRPGESELDHDEQMRMPLLPDVPVSPLQKTPLGKSSRPQSNGSDLRVDLRGP